MYAIYVMITHQLHVINSTGLQGFYYISEQNTSTVYKAM